MKETSVNTMLIKLEELIKQKRGTINSSEVALATGAAIDDINTGLARMLELYESKISMDYKSGAIVYDFAFPLSQRGKKTFKETMAQVGASFYRVFKKVYKVSIGVILIVYTVVFALILIGIMIASSSNRDNDRGGGFSFDFIGTIFMSIIHGMQMAAITSSMTEYATDSSGMRYQRVKSDTKGAKSFIASVYDFVFGPERLEQDASSDAKEVIAYLKKISNGKLTAGSILLLAGGDYPQSESKLAEYAGRFKGDLSISTDGTIVAEFIHLQNVEQSWLDGKIIYYFDEAEAPYVMNGNTSGKNFGIVAMNLFNLVASITLLGAFGQSVGLAIFLGIIPLLFSLIFFAVPLFRMVYNAKKNKERKLNIIKKKLFRGIVKNVNGMPSQAEIFYDGAILPEEQDTAKEILADLVIDYQGELAISDAGVPLYSFKRLSTELKIA